MNLLAQMKSLPRPALALGDILIPSSTVTVGEFNGILDMMLRNPRCAGMIDESTRDWTNAFIEIFGEQLTDKTVLFLRWENEEGRSDITPPRVLVHSDGEEFRLVVGTVGARTPLEIPEDCKVSFNGDCLHVTPSGGGRAIAIRVKINFERLIEISRPGGDMEIPGFPDGKIEKGDLKDYYQQMVTNAHATFEYAKDGMSVIAMFKPAKRANYGELRNLEMSHNGKPVPMILISSLLQEQAQSSGKTWTTYTVAASLPPGCGQKTSRVNKAGETVVTEFYAELGERTTAYLSVTKKAYDLIWTKFWEFVQGHIKGSDLILARLEGEKRQIILDPKSEWRIAMFVTGRVISAPDSSGQVKTRDDIEVGIWGPDGLVTEMSPLVRGAIREAVGETGLDFMVEHFKAAVATQDKGIAYPAECPYLKAGDSSEESPLSADALMQVLAQPNAEPEAEPEVEPEVEPEAKPKGKQGTARAKFKAALSQGLESEESLEPTF